MKYITVIGCKKCRRCRSICPAMAIEHIDGTARVKIIPEKCNLCMICVKMCPNKALKHLLVRNILKKHSDYYNSIFK